MYKNWEMKKTELNREKYSQVAAWCNKNQEYHIEEIGDVYKTVKNVQAPFSHEEIRKLRENYRREHIDGSTAERSRKMANGTWTEQDEQEYLALDAEVTAWIEKNLAYGEQNASRIFEYNS